MEAVAVPTLVECRAVELQAGRPVRTEHLLVAPKELHLQELTVSLRRSLVLLEPRKVRRSLAKKVALTT